MPTYSKFIQTPLLVQKYGGTSVASIERINAVAKQIASTKASGYRLIVVVSAMAGETNKLLKIAQQTIGESSAKQQAMSEQPFAHKREFDVIATSGEQVSMALLCLALQRLGIAAKSYCGWQVPIITNEVYGEARIKRIIKKRVINDLKQGTVVVIAGFQGVSANSLTYGNITTLGRGGSDTSAVALSIVFGAHECQIYTDVNGVYTADPNTVTQAKRIDNFSGTLMLEASSLGAKVLHVRSCELAYRYSANLRVLSTFAPHDQGTLIMNRPHELEQYPVISLAQEQGQCLLQIATYNKTASYHQLQDMIASIYGIANIDMLQVHYMPHGALIGFVTEENNVLFIEAHLDRYIKSINQKQEANNSSALKDLTIIRNLAKLSLIGSGFRSNSALNQQVWASIGNDIEVFSFAHNEISISFVVHQSDSATLRTRLSKLLG